MAMSIINLSVNMIDSITDHFRGRSDSRKYTVSSIYRSTLAMKVITPQESSAGSIKFK